MIARVVLVANKTVGERKVEPALLCRGIGVEGEIVGVAKVVEVAADLREAVRLLIPAFEDVDRAEAIVTEIVHRCNEDSAVWRFGEEADTLQTCSSDVDVEGIRKFEGDLLAGGVGKGVGTLRRNDGRRKREEEREQQCAGECSLHMSSLEDSELGEDGADEAGDVVGIGFDVWGPAVFAQRGAGNGADGDGFDSREWECDAGGVGDFGEMRDAGGAGEGSGVYPGCQGFAKLGGCVLRDGVLVGIDDVHDCAGGAQSVWDEVPGDGGAGEEDALATGEISHGFDEALGNVFLWGEGDGEAGFARCFGCCFADCCNLRFLVVVDKATRSPALCHCVNCVCAGEDEPVVCLEIAESGVERFVGSGWTNFEDGDLYGFGSGGSEAFAEFAGLVGGAGDEDSFVSEGLGGHRRHRCRRLPHARSRSFAPLMKAAPLRMTDI